MFATSPTILRAKLPFLGMHGLATDLCESKGEYGRSTLLQYRLTRDRGTAC